MLALFAYATLRDDEVRTRLFGEAVTGEPAALEGWQVVETSDAYFNIVPEPGAVTEGVLLHLSPEQWRLADAFEEVPLYRRNSVTARRADGETVEAQLYRRDNAPGKPVRDGRLSALPREALLAMVDAFRREWT
ncbi:MAG TPA: gamma-glutamylcyclotransferase family protein [Rhizomicrobium sp.]|nr:gamma-glutamylcyclotransferase family protein [Rhizomicrobium sp.]